ncbi:MAG TPA: HPF/RaiA family ribosome-associated protein [Anaeromyxobacteraceae bacterium]|nr:HPF/RaiA family ribosome-associated protein [Anaeromyxobacteraceae bacterium]
MQRSLQLRWRSITPSPGIEDEVRDEVAKLERAFARITGCAVTLEAPSRHHRQSGSKYRVRIELSVPGGKLVVGRDPTRTWTRGDLFLAVKAAFREARRQLEDHARRIDGRVKAHAAAARARVARLFPEEGYGFLETPDGREIYFHERSVLRDAFPRLRAGSAVRYVEEPGREGPQASTVERIGRVRSSPRPERGGAPW